MSINGPRYSSEELARTDPVARQVAGMLRRLVIDRTTKAIWKLLGYVLPSGKRETVNAEVFGGVGIAARPVDGNEAEAIVAFVGGRDQPIVIAARDEKTRQAVAGAIAAGETIVFNANSVVYLKADGTIEARSVGGVAVPLATQADVQALRDYVDHQFSATGGHTHAVVGGATTTIAAVAVPGAAAPTVAPPAPAGTSKLRGE